jgi:phosphoenolpyruvate---glycerone phosphotransferase subunit DhaL
MSTQEVAAMDVNELVSVLDQALEQLRSRAEMLRELDAAVGDGDLGITVDRGCAAIREALADSAPQTVGDVLKTTGAAFAKANPSTMAALAGGGLLAASKVTSYEEHVTPQVALTLGRAAMDRIKERGKAELGDKTILDAIAPSLDALASAEPGHALDDMIAAAQRGVDSTTDQAGRRGRASWVGERGVGHPDPGATLYVELLTTIRATLTGQPATPA